MLLQIYIWVVIIRVLISWVQPNPSNVIVQTLSALTDPLLDPIRRSLWRMMGYRGMMIDVSPIILIVTIYFLDHFLVGVLQDLGRRLR
jgi:YggT family protein